MDLPEQLRAQAERGIYSQELVGLLRQAAAELDGLGATVDTMVNAEPDEDDG